MSYYFYFILLSNMGPKEDTCLLLVQKIFKILFCQFFLNYKNILVLKLILQLYSILEIAHPNLFSNSIVVGRVVNEPSSLPILIDSQLIYNAIYDCN